MTKTQLHSSSFLFVSPQMAFPAQHETSDFLGVSFHMLLQPKSFTDIYTSDFKLHANVSHLKLARPTVL